jgi:nicotinamidase-related amidase
MKILVLMFSLFMAATPVFAETTVHPALEDPHTALLIIDIQAFYFPGGGVPLNEPERASAQAGRLLASFRERQRTIIHVGHKVASGGEFHPDVAPLPGEIVVMKSEVNAFRGTDLLKILTDAGIKQLVICGMQTHMCLEGGVRAAADQGFTCLVAGDACATRDLTRDDVVVEARAVHMATLATLDGVYATVLETGELLGKI